MNEKPSLKEFLESNPGKGLNDYFNIYGNEEAPAPVSTPVVDIVPVPPTPAPVAQNNKHVEQPRSYIASPTKQKVKVDIMSLLASILIVMGFFLPWMDMEKFNDAGDLTMVNGMDMYRVFSIFNLESFTDISNYTIYIILIGTIIAFVGELMKNWAVRVIGQMLAIPFGLYWAYKLYHLFSHTEIHAEELALLDYIQYGFFLVLGGVLLYFIDIIRTTFGNR